VSGFWLGVCLSIVTGALVNELSDLSPWLAVRVARLAARVRGWSCDDPEWAKEYLEAWPAEILERPGKLVKLAAALWLLIAVTCEMPSRGTRRIQLAYQRRIRRIRQQRPAVPDPRIDDLWRQFIGAFRMLFLHSMMGGLLAAFSQLAFRDLRPYVMGLVCVAWFVALAAAQRATYELFRALRNPPGGKPPLPSSAAVWAIMDRIMELLSRVRERLTKWLRVVQFTLSTVASYS
jgi:hypothetical protein